MKMLDCLFIGSVTKDIMMHVVETPKADHRVLCDEVCTTGGGIAGNSSSAFQKLGGNGGIISAIGDDEAGEFAASFIASRGLRFSQLITIPGKNTPFSSILVEPNGNRLICFYGGCIRSLTMDMLDKDALHHTKMIHLGGLDEVFIVTLAKYMKEHTKALVSVDGGNLSRACIDNLLPYTDIFIPDHKTVEKAGFSDWKEACRYFYEKGPETVVITMGENGSLGYDGTDFTLIPPIKTNVVDTTGAGDNFHGAFLYCQLAGYDMERTLKFCNTFSGICCEALGGSAAEPTLEETLCRMEKEYA